MRLFGLEFGKRSITVEQYQPKSFNDLFVTAGTVNKTVVKERNTLGISAAWACGKVLSESLASMPLNVYKRESNGDSNISINSPAQKLLLKPNNFMTRYDMILSQVLVRAFHGNSYCFIRRDGNNFPKELIPIHPDRVEVKVLNNEIVYYVDKNATPILAEDMLHFRGMTNDGIIGMSVISYHAQNLSLALAANEEHKNFYESGTSLDGVVEYDGKIDETVIKNTRLMWKLAYSGKDKNKTAFLDNGAKYKPIGMKPQDAQYLESKSYSVEEIARIFGVSLHLIGHLKQNSTNNNIEHQGIDFVTHGILPIAVSMELELNRKLLLPSEQKDSYFKFNLNGLMRGDNQSRAQFYEVMAKIQAMTPNEIRRLEELNSLEGGDAILSPLNMIDSTKLTDYHFKNGK